MRKGLGELTNGKFRLARSERIVLLVGASLRESGESTISFSGEEEKAAKGQ